MGRMQRSLREAHQNDVEATEKIATGKSVNSAKDNAAAFAVSTNLDAFSRSRRILARSLNTQLQISEIADDGLAEINNQLRRAKELAIQARSETLNADERTFVAEQFSATIDEIDQLAQTTRYRDKYLLRFRGIDVGFLVDRSSSMGGEAADVRDSIAAFQQIFVDGKLDAHMGVAHYYRANHPSGNDGGVDGTELYQDIGSADIEDALQQIVNQRYGGMVDPYAALLNASGVDDVGNDDTFSWRENTLKRVIIGVTDTGQEAIYEPAATEASTGADLANAGFEVHFINDTNENSAFDDLVSATGGAQFDIADLVNPTGPLNPLTGTNGIAQQLVTELQNQSGGGNRQIGIFNSVDDRVNVPYPVDVTPVNLQLADADVSTVAGAADAIDRIDAAIDTVNSLRADMGAFQRRLDSIMTNNIQTTAAETAALAMMTDADIAEEMAIKLRSQVKANAAAMMMMQANKLQRGTIEKLVA
jgi:flagellin